MGNNNSKCDLEWYQEFQAELFDFKNILSYALLYGLFQAEAFLSVFFPEMGPLALYTRDTWTAYRNTYQAQGNRMYSWQQFTDLFNFGIFGIGFMPGTYRCATLLFIKGLWQVPHKVIFDPEFDGYWARVLDNKIDDVEEE